MKDGWKVRALVREPDADKARNLLNEGAELVKGDFFDRASLDEAVKETYGVFSVQNFWLPDVGFKVRSSRENYLQMQPKNQALIILYTHRWAVPIEEWVRNTSRASG